MTRSKLEKRVVIEQFLSCVSCFVAIFIVASTAESFNRLNLVGVMSPVLLASMGASAVVLFFMPQSPISQPQVFFVSHLVSAVVGIACAQYVPNFVLAAACSVSASALAMLILRCFHPPACATSLVLTIIHADFNALFFPVFINVLTMLISAIALNRWLLKRDYPQQLKPAKTNETSGLTQQDVQDALKKGGEFVDVNLNQLHELLLYAEQQKLKRLHGDITCAEIMTRTVTTVEYGEEVETTWQTMHREKLKSIPVLDKANRVIGIITWADFFKFVELSPYVSFQDKFLTFIRRTQAVTTNKPEVAGHIMNKKVVVLPESASVTDLIMLFSTQGHGQIPIVDSEKRLVGMVYQANLITILSQLV